jgi:hypothetical protein
MYRMDYQFKWSKPNCYSWAARRIRTDGKIHGTISCLSNGPQASFEGTLPPTVTASFFEIAARIPISSSEVIPVPPVMGILAIAESRSILAIYPSENAISNFMFEQAAGLLEPEIRIALKKTLEKDAIAIQALRIFLDG